MDISVYPFICPVCAKPLVLSGRSYVCPSRHLFDVSRSGYVNLLPVNKKNSLDPGDNNEMIVSRLAVMDKGYYASLADTIVSLLSDFSPRSILDAGCGTGYLTSRLHEAFPSALILGADISKYAINAASKRYKDIPFTVATSNYLPVATSSVDAVVCAFAPVFDKEFTRVLSTGGVFVRVIPGPKHLFNLKGKLYETPVENELDPENVEGFEFVKSEISEGIFRSENAEEILSLVKMTPYFYHAPSEKIDALSSAGGFNINQQFVVRLYRKK
ncbi:MAG TPA: methyltransferase domain-containing protein [Clostridia bacterium]|jgi:23S rRNA (guanine745-N1)-methyltransferase|nr:methyltransferase domain-containing protein [Clostridia bacterium]